MVEPCMLVISSLAILEYVAFDYFAHVQIEFALKNVSLLDPHPNTNAFALTYFGNQTGACKCRF